MNKKFLLPLIWVCFTNFELGLSESNVLKSEVEEFETGILAPVAAERIVGGSRTLPGKYPWMISLHEDAGSGFEHICGGTVLDTNWILTAAHCIDFVKKPYKYLVYAGLHKLSRMRDSTVQKIKVANIFLHEDFDEVTYENDIALLKTADPINIVGSEGYIGISLPRTEKDPEGNAKVIGWGHTYQDGENSDTLKEVVVPIIPRDICNESYDEDAEDGIDEIRETMICAGMAKRDSCSNDSGGPLFQTSSAGVSTLIGVVSHGAGCGEKYFPGVYTKISPYKTWIENIMSK